MSSIAAVNAGCHIAFRPPFGDEILFRAHGRSRNTALFVMNADGTNVRTLIEPTNPVDVGEDLNNATYSADGSRIFYPALVRRTRVTVVGDERGRPDPHEFFPEPGSGLGRRPPHPSTPTADGSPDWHRRIQRRAGDISDVSVVRADRDSARRSIPTGPAPVGRWRSFDLVAGSTNDPDRSRSNGEHPVRILRRPRPAWSTSTTVPWQIGRRSTRSGSAWRPEPAPARPTAPFAGQERTPGGRARGSRCMRLGCGERIRTSDLRVMSPTSCRCSTPRPVTLGPKHDSVKRS